VFSRNGLYVFGPTPAENLAYSFWIGIPFITDYDIRFPAIAFLNVTVDSLSIFSNQVEQ
jgi:hypothetical protein